MHVYALKAKSDDFVTALNKTDIVEMLVCMESGRMDWIKEFKIKMPINIQYNNMHIHIYIYIYICSLKKICEIKWNA